MLQFNCQNDIDFMPMSNPVFTPFFFYRNVLSC